MSERSKMISKLIGSRTLRESYIRSKLGVLLPAQIRSLRLRREMTQAQLGEQAEMKQARISALERIGEGNFSVETLIRIAAAFGVGLVVKFVPFSEMLGWENAFEPDSFDAISLQHDMHFLDPGEAVSPVYQASITYSYWFTDDSDKEETVALPRRGIEVKRISPPETRFANFHDFNTVRNILSEVTVQ